MRIVGLPERSEGPNPIAFFENWFKKNIWKRYFLTIFCDLKGRIGYPPGLLYQGSIQVSPHKNALLQGQSCYTSKGQINGKYSSQWSQDLRVSRLFARIAKMVGQVHRNQAEAAESKNYLCFVISCKTAGVCLGEFLGWQGC